MAENQRKKERKERKNAKLRMQFMPKKYWQDLVEKL